MPSDIQVFVRFREQCVFAGEELSCTITFRNVADIPEVPASNIAARKSSRQGSISKIVTQSIRNASSGRILPSPRATSVSQVNEYHLQPTVTPSSELVTSPAGVEPQSSQRPGQKHQRSVSIISLASASGVTDNNDATLTGGAHRQVLAHRRSSTVQVISGTQRRPSQYHRDASSSSHIPVNTGRRTPLESSQASTPAMQSRESTPDFRFPAAPPTPGIQVGLPKHASRDSPSPPTRRGHPTPQVQRVVSDTSHGASERSSAEFYSLSNHSQETLISEQPSVLSDRPQITANLLRQPPRINTRPTRRSQAVNLLMGYAQLNATFIVDGSLVNQSQFEEVKKKGFLGGQGGGGVVGIQKARPNSGFLGGFNFNSIGESLNSLVSGDNMSSVREMNAVTNSRSIPLLSTPQSLLFVDLHLEPGEEKSYAFSYSLPRGLPSSHRGKVIKISYNILVGVQGVPGARDVHAMRQISVPVRVFSGVDSDGEIFGHDLMQPYVILRDLARTKQIDSSDYEERYSKPPTRPSGSSTEFLTFVDTLLDRNRRRQSSSGAMDPMFGIPDVGDGQLAMQAISRAILLSNRMPSEGESSPNRFEISRGGSKVAVIMLDRALHRLGETVTAVVDFTEGQTPCSSLHSTLETSERIDSGIAVRSTAAVSRMTRKVYASHSDNVLFGKRAVFAPSIPPTATPTFLTSGINLDWCLRFEFGTIKPVELDDGGIKSDPALFEEVVKDERGVVNIAVERLECDTFEVVIPLTVYGDIVSDGKEERSAVGIPL